MSKIIKFFSIKFGGDKNFKKYVLDDINESLNVKFHPIVNDSKGAKTSGLTKESKDLNYQLKQMNQPIQYINISKEYQLNCRKIEKSVLNDKKVTITIQNPKAVETSIFKSNYISYEIILNNQLQDMMENYCSYSHQIQRQRQLVYYFQKNISLFNQKAN